MKELYWNFNEQGEYWSNTGDTIEGCLIDAREEVKDFEEEEGLEKGEIQSVFIGELDVYSPQIHGEDIAEIEMERAFEKCGECSEGWFYGVTKEQYENLSSKLTKTFNDWLKENKNEPTFGSIENIKEYDLKTGKEII